MTRVLVTGGSGFIGSNLVTALVRRGYDVRVFDNNFRGKEGNLRSVWDQIEFIKGDIRDPVQVSNATKGVDVVYHLAFINGTEFFYKYPELVLEVGIKGHLNIMEACHKSQVQRFIYASSSEVYQVPKVLPTPENIACVVPEVGNPRYSYGGSKILGELLTIHYRPEAPMIRSIFRPHNIYGIAMGFEHVIPQIIYKICSATDFFSKKQASISIQGSGTETRAFCYIDDAVRGILLLQDKGLNKEIYHLGTNQETAIISLVLEIAEILHIKLEVSKGPLQKGSTPRRCPDISKLMSLGYKPNTSLRAGLFKTVEWYKEYFAKNT
jgi:nucleoside-diphosphate-sugar epimerase